MQHRAIKSLLVAMLFVCGSTVLLWSVLSRLAAHKTRELGAPEHVFGAGMGPNLMTPKPINSSDNSIKTSFDDLIETICLELDDGGTITTRRYMSTLIAGEGCKLYVDYGDGNWVPWEDDNTNSIQTDDTVNPFGDALSDSSPLD